MSGNPPVFSRNGAKFPIYVQTDAFPAVYNSLKELIHGCEGVVLDAPDRALAICITNRDTPLGANLIAKYYQADTTQHRRGVVDYHWVNACVDAQALLGPPSWGGFYLSPLTLDHFFNPSPPTTSQPSPSPSLSQATTLVSPLYTPQYLPPSDGKPTPSPRKPSLPTIPQQILQKFQPSGPSGSPTGCYSPSNATTAFGEDQLSRQLSATVDESSSTDYDPAPAPPPENQKKAMTGGRSNKYYYTDAENDFIVKYMAWAERHGVPSPTASHQMCLLVRETAFAYEAMMLTNLHMQMPWHPSSSLMSQMSRLTGVKGNKGWAYVSDGHTASPYFSQPASSSKYDRLKLSRRLSSDQSKSTSVDGRRRTRNNSTGVGPALLPERLMMWPPAEAPPEAPRPGPPSDPEFGHPFTPEDKVYVVEFTRWAGRRVPDIDLPLLSAALEQFAPHHSRAKWFGHMSKYSNQYAKRVPSELAHLFLDMSSDEDDDEAPHDKKSRRAEESDASGSGTPTEPSSKITAPATVQKATPRGGRGGQVVPYTDEELDSMAKLLAQNRNRSLNSLFTEFAASRVGAGLQPQRKGSSYAQYARTHGEWLKTRGRSLLGLPATRNTSNGVGTRGRFDEEVAFEDPWNSDGDAESDDNHGSTPLPAIEEETGRKKRGPLVAYTEEELDSMAKSAVENPDTPVGALFSEFAASRQALGLQPQRKAHTYTEYYRRHSETLNQRGYLLLEKESQSPEKRPKRSSTSSTVSPKKPPTPMDDTFSDLPADDARLGQPYTEDDYNALTNFLARHPALFRNSEEGKSTSKQTLWQKFDQEYPGRSSKAWREFFRKRADRLEEDALALIEENQNAAKTNLSQDAQQSDRVSPVAESTADVSTLKSQPSGSSATVSSKNSINATTSTIVGSPLSPKSSPGGTKRALSADPATDSSAPAAKKLKEALVD